MEKAKKKENVCNHTPCPEGYIARSEWAKSMSRTHRQTRCKVCGLFAVWVEREKKLTPAQYRLLEELYNGGTVFVDNWAGASTTLVTKNDRNITINHISFFTLKQLKLVVIDWVGQSGLVKSYKISPKGKQFYKEYKKFYKEYNKRKGQK